MDKKEHIIEAICQMDSVLLEALLDDKKTYQGAPKELFLLRLEEQFQRLREGGDVYLNPLQGECNAAYCKKNHEGFAFVGDRSGDHIDLIFEEEELTYSNIFDCTGFDAGEQNKEYGRKLPIMIFLDELIKKEIPAELLSISDSCKKAYEELVGVEGLTLNDALAKKWLRQHRTLYTLSKPLIDYFRNAYRFERLYERLEGLYHCLNSNDMARMANKEWSCIDLDDEIEILKWLVLYEDLQDDLCGLIITQTTEYDYPIPDDGRPFRDYPFKFDIDEFSHVIEFNNTVDAYYDDMLDKYNTMDDDEEDSEFPPYSGEYGLDDYYTLSYHLRVRGIVP
jgi:hypothetical protein